MRTEILGVPFDALTMNQAIERSVEYIKEGTENRLIFTPNPEMVMEATRDQEFMDILRKGDLVVPDGIGIVLASKFSGGVKISERVAGFDLVNGLFREISKGEEKISVYLFGGKPGICEAAKKNLEKKYSAVKICGYSDGFFNEEKEKNIVEEIRHLKPDVLLCGIGMKKQEKWLYIHRDLPVKLSAGVGGSLDVFAGAVKRAPLAFQRLGLEWFYRLLCQPKRIVRMLQLPIFAVKVLADGLIPKER